ncbi:MAG: glycerol-3-phosphate 1-O-acyltransferase PlsY [Leptospirales bacterium]|nr:glycerol-3-phosphate 1-O-acyltransferase PlsY [Leptospirales bacterium]
MTETQGLLLLGAPVAFLMGSTPFSYLLARLLAGVDIRQEGSGNPGASNVYRVVGPAAGVATLILDAGKGAAAVLLVLPWRNDLSAAALVWLQIAFGLAAVAGHVWTPFLGWKGGKGVATLIGVFAALFPLGILAAAGAGVIVIGIFRYFSLGSLVGVSILPLAYFLYVDEPWRSDHLPILWMTVAAVLITLYRHSENIRRLWRGEELGMAHSRR